MTKEKIFHTVNSHPRFFRFCSNVYNRINPNNKWRTKGCKLTVGISVIKGLKIVNHGVDNEILIGDFTRINRSAIIISGDHNRIDIGDFSCLNQVELYMEDSNNEICIGEHTGLCGKAHFAAIEGTKILIGNRCLFSGDLHFRTGDSHSILDLQGNRINPSKDIVIEDHVWVGTRVTCLKGVRVARDSVVAATTTLNKEYTEPNVIIGGVPGKIIKRDVNWSSHRI